jgi:hypothetical protein
MRLRTFDLLHTAQTAQAVVGHFGAITPLEVDRTAGAGHLHYPNRRTDPSRPTFDLRRYGPIG